jgi:hypothetical protein
LQHDRKCATVFSAANYENIDKNEGAVLQITMVDGVRKGVVKRFAARHYPVTSGVKRAAGETKWEEELN